MKNFHFATAMYTAYPPAAGAVPTASGGPTENSAAAANYYSSVWYNRKQGSAPIAEAPPAPPVVSIHSPVVQGMEYDYPPTIPISSELSHHYSSSPYGSRHWPNNWSSTFNDLANYYNNLSHQGQNYRANLSANDYPPFCAERNESFHGTHMNEQQQPNQHFMGVVTAESERLKNSLRMNNNNNSICKLLYHFT